MFKPAFTRVHWVIKGFFWNRKGVRTKLVEPLRGSSEGQYHTGNSQPSLLALMIYS